MKQLIERFRMWLGLKLLLTNQVTMTSKMMSQRVEHTRCLHCGKNPYFIGAVTSSTKEGERDD